MASSPGRTSDSRTVPSVVTNSTTAITFGANTINVSDIGRTVTGTGIPAGTTLAARPTSTTGTLSASATTSTTQTVTLGAASSVNNSLGFNGYSVETDAESAVYPIAAGAGASAPSVLSDAVTRVTQRNR